MSAVLLPVAGRLRPMHETDLEEVMQIEEAVYPFPWTPGIFRDCLRVGYVCWVLEDTTAMQGYGVMSIGAGEGHILNLCVAPEYQRQGMGRKILVHLIQSARKHFVNTLLLEVRQTNLPALGLYHDLGFNEVGSRPNYYPDTGGREDALILALELIE